jgi:hypothetical protein
MANPLSYPDDHGPFDAAAEAEAETPEDDKVFTADDDAHHEDDDSDALDQSDGLAR